MDKTLKERVQNAPSEILVEVKQRHLDKYHDSIFQLTNNPIVAALEEQGWEASISMFNAFIGTSSGLVNYKPETDTTYQMQELRLGETIKPFIARFVKDKTS